MRSLSKEDIIKFYNEHIANFESRKKLSCHVVSVCEGGAGHSDTPAMVNGVDDSANDDKEKLSDEEKVVPSQIPRHVTDITSFKASLPLFPLAQPYVQPDMLKRPCKPSP